MPKHKRLTMVYSAEDRDEKLEDVEVDSDGNVTIGVPLITAAAVPPPPDDEEESN